MDACQENGPKGTVTYSRHFQPNLDDGYIFFCDSMWMILWICGILCAPYIDSIYGGFLKWWYPQNTPKWLLLVGKPMVVGETHHFRNMTDKCDPRLLDPWPRTRIRSAPSSPTINTCFFGEWFCLVASLGWKSGVLVGKLEHVDLDFSEGNLEDLFREQLVFCFNSASTCALHLWTLMDPFSSLQKEQNLRDGKLSK